MLIAIKFLKWHIVQMLRKMNTVAIKDRFATNVWLIIFLVMIWFGTIIDLLKKPFPDANTVEIITLYGGVIVILFAIAKWGKKQYLLNHPFRIKEAYENYDFYMTDQQRTLSPFLEPIRIRCLNSEWWHNDRINMYFEVRRKIDLERINLRFVEKQIFRKAKDAPRDIISIKDINFPQEKYYSEVNWYDDKKGGKNGIFNPPISLSKGNIIFIEVYPDINVPKVWKGYIGLDNSSRDEKRTFTRKRIVITNELI